MDKSGTLKEKGDSGKKVLNEPGASIVVKEPFLSRRKPLLKLLESVAIPAITPNGLRASGVVPWGEVVVPAPGASKVVKVPLLDRRKP